jgi:hypothetical protein
MGNLRGGTWSTPEQFAAKGGTRVAFVGVSEEELKLERG